uniref:Uncharacterized protein n=1 Tax=Rhizophora mucronata TaxID=61149 RepID=A0A2P2NNQ5_RHIMU
MEIFRRALNMVEDWDCANFLHFFPLFESA